MDLRLDGRRVEMFDVAQRGAPTEVSKITIGGPYDVTGRGETPSRAKIFVCRPASAAGERPCARTILTKLARRAFRRPAKSSDVEPLLAFYDRGRGERRGGAESRDFDAGIQRALEALLVAPPFLFRVEQDSNDRGAGGVRRVSDVDLASRLSFFLWSSIPDEELLDRAERAS